MPELTIAARDLKVGDVIPGEGSVTKILRAAPGLVLFELDWNIARSLNHGDPVRIHREEAGR